MNDGTSHKEKSNPYSLPARLSAMIRAAIDSGESRESLRFQVGERAHVALMTWDVTRAETSIHFNPAIATIYGVPVTVSHAIGGRLIELSGRQFTATLEVE